MRGLGSGFAGAERHPRALTWALSRAGFSLAVLAWVARCAAPSASRAGSERAPTAVSALRAGEPAAAAQGRRLLRLDYSAPAECPDQDTYARQVESRATTLEVEPVSAAAAPRSGTQVSIALEAAAGSWHGSVSIVDGEVVERSVSGERCADVVEALALITVLRLEPGTRSDTAARVADEPSPSAAEQASSAAAAAAGAAEPHLATRDRDPEGTGPADAISRDEASGVISGEAEPAASPDEAEPAAELRAGTETSGEPALESPESGPHTGDDALDVARSRASAARDLPEAEAIAGLPELSALGPGSSSTSPLSDEPPEALQPSASRAAPLRGNVAAYVGYASVPSDALALALQLELLLGDGDWAASVLAGYSRGAVEALSGSGALNLLTAQLQLCAPGLRSEPRIWVAPCAQLRGGLVVFEVSPGELTLEAPGALRPWAALGPSLQAGAPLSSAWTLRALGAVSLQLVRDWFEVELRSPDDDAGRPMAAVPIYRPEPLSFEFSVGLSYTF